MKGAAMKQLILCFVFLLLSSSGYGLTKYGEATVKKGGLTILRDGKRLSFTAGDNSIQILKKDVLRAGKKSLITLNTVQNTTVELGSYAIFQVRPFKISKNTGDLRMLYGKARFKTVGNAKAKSRRFRLRTATAVIGVKGTEWIQQTNSSGTTDTEVREGIVGISTEMGVEIDVSSGHRALALSGKKVSKPIKVKKPSVPSKSISKDEDQDSIRQPDSEATSENLDAVSPTSNDSVNIDAQDFYVDQGVFSLDDFQEAERETEIFDLGTQINKEKIIDEIIENVEQEVEETTEAAVEEASSKQIKLSISFEK